MSFIAAAIGVASLATAVTGGVLSYKGGQANQASQQAALADQQALEQQREKAMNLDAMRRQRSIVRQAQAARSQSLAVATNQGAGGGSGPAGAYAGVTAQAGNASVAIQQNQDIAKTEFGINAATTGYEMNSTKAGGSMALGSGLTSLGGAIASNAGTETKIGTQLSSGFKSWFGGSSSFGAQQPEDI